MKFLIVAMLLSSLSLFAETKGKETAGGEGQQSDRGRMKRRPPKEALDACTGKTSGTACTFTGPRGTMTGKCWSPKTDLPLACKPERKPENGQGGDNEMPPPQEEGGRPE